MHAHAKRLVRLAMATADVNYKQLARLLAEDDPSSTDTPESLTTLVNRGTFSFAFVLRVYRALDIQHIDLTWVFDDLPRRTGSKAGGRLR